MSRLSFKQKLFYAFGLITAVTVLGASLSLHEVSAVHADFVKVLSGNNVRIALANSMMEQQLRIQLGVRNLVLYAGVPGQSDVQHAGIADGRKRYSEAYEKVARLSEGSKDREILERVDANAKTVASINEKALALIEAGHVQDAGSLLAREVLDPQAKLFAALREYVVYAA